MKYYALIAVLPLCGAQTAYAAPDSHHKTAGWALQVTPYIWAASLDGDISPFQSAPTINVAKPFSDVLDDLNFGGFLNIWGRYDRFVFSSDMMYVDTTDMNGSGPLAAMQIPGLGITIPPGANVAARVDSKQFMASLQGGYRVVDTPQFTLDALGGARLWRISNDVTVTASHFAISTISVSHGESFSWVDPVIGLRAFHPVTEKLSIQGQADLGGFGAGSDLTWSALATVNYSVADRLSFSAGYKILDVDYNHGGYAYNTRMSGPVLGATVRF